MLESKITMCVCLSEVSIELPQLSRALHGSRGLGALVKFGWLSSLSTWHLLGLGVVET